MTGREAAGRTGTVRVGPVGTIGVAAVDLDVRVDEEDHVLTIGRLGEVGGVDDLLDTLAVRTAEVVAAFRDDDGALLARPTLLPGWTGLEVACHLRYGAEASLRMTLAALHEEETSRYPAGRPRQRPGTLAPRAGEQPSAVVRSLAAASGALGRLWQDLRPADWQLPVVGARSEDPRELSVHELLVLRLTEVEVHGTDLGAGLPAWSRGLVTSSLPLRLARLDGRWPQHEAAASWLLEVVDGPTWAVHARRTVASAGPVTGDPPPVDARITGDATAMLALLLGRPDWDALTIDGDHDTGRSFAETFPGP